MHLEEFRDLVERGMGRAVLFLKEHDAAPYREVLLEACLHDQRLDYQLDNLRGRYLYDLIQATGDAAYYRERVLSALLQGPYDQNLSQLLDLAARFAIAGDEEARRTIYATFDASDDQFSGLWTIVEMDGLDGFLYAAPRFAALPSDDGDMWMISSALENVEEQLGAEAVWPRLEEASAGDPDLRKVLDWIKQYRSEKPHARQPEPPSHIDNLYSLLRHTNLSSIPGTFRRWGRYAPEDALREAAGLLLAEQDADRLDALVRVFATRPFPGNPARLIELAEYGDEKISWAARIALTNVTHPDVRALALRLVQPPADPGYAVAMLSSNYEEGDHARVLRLLERDHDPDDFHRVEMDTFRLVDSHPAPEDIAILTTLYEKGYCTFCRETCVDKLIKLNALPDWMREECRYDSNPEIRKVVDGA